MRCYFAPMEGLTDSIYRRTHHKYFPDVDRYYMPFLSPTGSCPWQTVWVSLPFPRC